MTPQGRQWPHSAVFNANFEQISCLVLVFEQENVGWIYHNKSCIFFFWWHFLCNEWKWWSGLLHLRPWLVVFVQKILSNIVCSFSFWMWHYRLTRNFLITVILFPWKYAGEMVFFLLSFTGKLKWMINYLMINYLFCLFVLSHDLKANWEIFRLTSFRGKSIVVLKMYNSWIEKNNENEIIHEKYMKSFSVSIISNNDK